ncbi:MAG: MFS transporter, partial [Candidatus Methylacidiphilales bacterium]|nr:MFS transporter [Candidatus Methylacidiphilales bacterium]
MSQKPDPNSADFTALTALPSDAEKSAAAHQGNFPPVTRGEIFSWCCFDFANSSFTTVVVSVIFGLTFTKVIAPPGEGETWWGVALFIAQAFVVVFSPFLGAWADFTASKKKLLFASYITCVTFTALLAFTGPTAWVAAMVCFIIAYIAFSMGENFSSSFLPELSTPDNIGRISGYGWSFGYLGGLLSLGICFPFLAGDDAFSLKNLANLQNTNLIVAAFFGLAALPTFLFLHERATPSVERPSAIELFVAIWRQVFRTLYKVAT